MNPEHHKRVSAVFLATFELPPDERAAAIDRACAGDETLRQDVNALLARHDDPEAIPDRPALGSGFHIEPTVIHADGANRLLGQRIGGYRLKRVIATGGMGTVYEAVQDRPRRTVAIKVMRAGIASRSALRRFEYESQVLARLRHPNIAQIYEAGTYDDGGDRPYFVLEYIPNARSITTHANERRLSARQRLVLFAKVCSAVHHGHQKGIIHRDLKPANILVDSDGEPRIIDFGVARATDSDLAFTTIQTEVGQLIGTLQYMSPEQCEADPHDLDTRSDVYALGVVLYELLCGQLPYDVTHAGLHEAVRVVREEPPVRPSTINRMLRGDAETIVLKALEKDRSRRYQSANDLGMDIRRYLSGDAIAARRPSLAYLAWKLVTRHKLAALLVLTGPTVLILLAATVVSAMFAAQAVQARDVAEQRLQALEISRKTEHVQRTLLDLQTFIFSLSDELQLLDGAVAARRQLAQTAWETLQQLEKEAGGDPSVWRDLASAYLRVGDIRGGPRNRNLGDREGAMECYGIALRLLEKLAGTSRDDDQVHEEIAATYTRIGDVLRAGDDAPGALQAYLSALKVREQLTDEPRNRRQLALLLWRVADLKKESGQLTEVRRYLVRAGEVLKKLVDQHPDDQLAQRDLSVTEGRLAAAWQDQGDQDAALRQYLEQLRIRQDLLEQQPESGRAQRDVAVTHFFVGRTLLDLDRPDAALEHLQYFVEFSEQSASANPQKWRPQRDLACGHEAVGRAYAALGDWPQALDRYQTFQSLILRLNQQQPQNTQFRELVATSHEHLGEAAAADQRPDDALEHYATALEDLDALLKDVPDDFDARISQTRLHLRVGRTLAEVGDRAQARLMLESAQSGYESLLKEQPEKAELHAGLAATIDELSKLLDPGASSPP